MHVKSVGAQSFHVGVMWKCGERVESSYLFFGRHSKRRNPLSRVAPKCDVIGRSSRVVKVVAGLVLSLSPVPLKTRCVGLKRLPFGVVC
ncbi:hypothetical protein TNCV_3918831 [Trichonephila clavipes]|nr:hypothetical protein TNCV_3918831 [Trichonephila clavipes]